MSQAETARSIIAPFADQATEIETLESGDVVSISFTRREFRRTISFLFDPSGEIFVRTTPQGTKQTLRTFLASSEMADLDALARSQMGIFQRRSSGRKWIAGPASLDGDHSDDSIQSLQLATQQVSGKTTVVVLDGPAGIGKTALLERLAAEHATEYLARRGSMLSLVVSSRGRRLSRLSDAIAATIADFRVFLHYSEIPILVRHGLLKLAIDGFDELVSQEGYDIAWSSLEELISSVEGGGVLVLSSRDTFFSEQQFIHRAHRNDDSLLQRVRFRFLRLEDWKQTQVQAFLEQSSVPRSKIEAVLSTTNELSGPLLARPFFLRELAERLSDVSEDDIDMLLPVLVRAFVQRESRLLFSQNEQTLGEELLWRFFEEIALEMRRQERDLLDVRDVQFFLDIVFEDGGIGAERRRALTFRASSLAFMQAESDGGTGKRGFPHQVIRDSFIARALVRGMVERQRSLTDTLRLWLVNLDIAEVFLVMSEYWSSERRSKDLSVAPLDEATVRWLVGLAADRGAADPVAMNIVTLALTLCRAAGSEFSSPLELRGFYCGAASIASSTLPQITISQCSFGYLDAVDSNLAGINAGSDVHIESLRLSEATAFGSSWHASIGSLDVVSASGSSRERDPAKIQSFIINHSVRVSKSPESFSPAEQVFDRLVRRWIRRFWLDESDLLDEPAFGSPEWPLIRQILSEFGRLNFKVGQAAGPARQLTHLKAPKQLMDRSDAEAKQIWARISKL